MPQIEATLAEIGSDLKHVVRLVEKHDRTLYGESGGNGIVSYVERHNELERKANRLILWVAGLIVTNLGTLLKLFWVAVST